MQSPKITTENWTCSSFQNNNYLSFISLGGRPGLNGEAELSYFVTTTDLRREQEFFQKSYQTLEEAIEHLNRTCRYWNFVDGEFKDTSDGGCGSCAAH